MGPRPWAWFWGRLLGKENQPDAGESRAWINLMELRIRVPFGTNRCNDHPERANSVAGWRTGLKAVSLHSPQPQHRADCSNDERRHDDKKPAKHPRHGEKVKIPLCSVCPCLKKRVSVGKITMIEERAIAQCGTEPRR